MTGHRSAGLAAAAAAFVAFSGYVATELIERSAPPVKPPSPYTAPKPSPDCGTPELDPVHCPFGGGCPTPAATVAAPAAGTMPVPDPTSQRPADRFLLEQKVSNCVEDRAVYAD
ncbi:hypothetical protein ACTMTU_01210 [Streptomyces sp. OZ13]|uniref:hypothetical protein n=1 Tax=Streptomyces sp. OZ13 TaxID=3452210 RepID=UPI003F8BA4FB